ncbi:MAG TPA: type II toxin-antitoxin system VapC family toxin [Rhizobiaceae bacterium]|nr:type II toxin-antitoxin system VapC family toxin [Rhizobiaceae bacterium]
MLVEPSAILAVLKEEPDAQIFRDRIASVKSKVVLVVGKVEAAISLSRKLTNRDAAPGLVTRFCENAEIEVVSVHADIYEEATTAYRRYGKGTGHPAQLNFGDCFSYAYAKKHGVPLLFKGEDFSKTDIVSAL